MKNTAYVEDSRPLPQRAGDTLPQERKQHRIVCKLKASIQKGNSVEVETAIYDDW